jgi:hypothetical protein
VSMFHLFCSPLYSHHISFFAVIHGMNICSRASETCRPNLTCYPGILLELIHIVGDILHALVESHDLKGCTSGNQGRLFTVLLASRSKLYLQS